VCFIPNVKPFLLTDITRWLFRLFDLDMCLTGVTLNQGMLTAPIDLCRLWFAQGPCMQYSSVVDPEISKREGGGGSIPKIKKNQIFFGLKC
jgi:hypothetical protein